MKYEDGKYMEHKMGAVKSSDLKNWADISDQLSFLKGARHGSVFKVSQKILDNLLANGSKP